MKTMIYVVVLLTVLGFAKHVASDFSAPAKNVVSARTAMLNNL